MKKQTLAKLRLKNSAHEMPHALLAKRFTRWQLWALRLSTRAGFRVLRLSPGTERIFLRRISIISAGTPANFWRVYWQSRPLSLQLTARFFDRRYEARMNSQTQTHVPNTFSTSSQSLFKQTALARNYSSQNAVSKPGVSFLTPRGRRQLQHRKTGRNERPETKQTRRTELSPPLELKNFQPILMSKIFKAAEESGRLFTQSPARVVMRSQPVVFASGVVLRRENLRIEAFLNHGKTGRFERLETLTHQLVHSRQRVESREGYAKIPAGPLSVSSEAGLRQMLAPNDSRPQFLRQPRIIQESTPSRADLRPMPPLTVNQLTDKVMQQIDRRLVIWRERTGRV